MKVKGSVWLLLILLKCSFSVAQTFNFKNFNTEQGLPQSQVLSIFQDHKGYMWFGTNSGGAAKFDGINFKVFNTNAGIIDNNIFSISETSNNQMLFATSKGLSVFGNEGFKNYGVKEGLKNPLINKLLTDKETTWVCTQEGVYIYSQNKITAFTANATLNKSSVYSVFKDTAGKVWFGTIQNGIVCYNPSNKTFKEYKFPEQANYNLVFTITQSGNGDILISCQKGLYRIGKNDVIADVTEIPRSENISYTAILVNKNNQLYYGTQTEGVKLFDFDSSKRLASYTRKGGLTNSPVMCLFKDNENNLWIGTDGSGVYKYNNDKFTYFNKTTGFTENYVTAVNVDSENNIWAGLKNSGIVKISNNQIEKYLFDVKKPDNIPDNNITATLPLDNMQMLFGTIDGLCLYNGKTFSTISENNFRHQYITALYKDKHNTIWIGTSEGLFKLTGNKPYEVEELKKYKQEGQQFPIYFITEDNEGKLWFASNANIYSLEKNQLKEYKASDNGTGYIYSGAVDKDNNLWLGTESGLFVFKKGGFISIPKTKKYPSSFVNFLQLDKTNKLYVGSNNGIDIIDINEFNKSEFKYKHLGKDDGLLSLESNFNASAIDKTGKILVGTIGGLEIYNPELDKANENEARISILDVKLFYGELNINEYAKGRDPITLLPLDLKLPFTKNNLTFQFNGICLIAPEKVMYQFKLEGIDDHWSPPGNKTEITYPSLPAGTFTFFVKATNNDGIWNKTPAGFIFTILPPWYNTWWFYITCVITLVFGVLAYNNYRTKKLIADKVRLENTVNIRTSELRAEKEKVESINKEVTLQKQEIEHKNIEITDSIKYAKNIQEALLPSLTETEKAFNNCFVLYLPKDIVSGDFFWYAKKNNLQYIAAVDCTGHGVPGAFMSIVGNTLLNEIVNDKGITTPGDILLELHKSVKMALNNKNTDSERRDGMDIALCCINKNSNSIEYSGANRGLWIFRKNKEFELEIIKPTKQPIGGLELEESRTYQNHVIEVFEGDFIYIFSDGFADQFGGEKGKKFMLSNMQKHLAANLHLSMGDQKNKIKETFYAWKRNLEQVDDVLVIGIKV